MLTAFLDESGSAEDGKDLVLAGYCQRASVWTAFSDEWQAVLDAAPIIPHFHMHEAESKKGVFLGWDQDAIRRKVSDLADVIVKHELWSVECRISVAAFNRILKPVAPFDLQNPYFYLFSGVIEALAQLHIQDGVESPVDVVMDQHEASPYVIGLYPVLKMYMAPERAAMLGDSPIFRDDQKVLPLQAADLLAWHIRRAGEKRNARERRRVHSKLFPVKHIASVIEADVMRSMATKMQLVQGVEDTRGRKGSIILPPIPEKPAREHRVGEGESSRRRLN